MKDAPRKSIRMLTIHFYFQNVVWLFHFMSINWYWIGLKRVDIASFNVLKSKALLHVLLLSPCGNDLTTYASNFYHTPEATQEN